MGGDIVKLLKLQYNKVSTMSIVLTKKGAAMTNYLKEYIVSHPLKMITYAEYMGLALYHPEHGYYMKNSEKIGRTGDFITTSNISDFYGRTIAKWFFKEKNKYELPPAVCEIGAGTGRFAKAFLNEWKQLSTEPLQYSIVEKSPFHRKLQKEVLHLYDGVHQFEEIEEIHSFKGLVFSNELFDALPVHVIQNINGDLMEVMVTIKNGELSEAFIPLENQHILHFVQQSGMRLKNNQRIEIPLQMEEMISKMSNMLLSGLVLTVDYGYTNEDWQEPLRRDGSLRGYYQHQQVNDVLKYPGEMDMTSHVHFDSLIRIGNEYGLHYQQMWRQDEFLLSAGILEYLQDHYDPNPFSEISKKNRAIRSLIMPGGISTAFHVILQTKNN